jgi:hypothetical protein
MALLGPDRAIWVGEYSAAAEIGGSAPAAVGGRAHKLQPRCWRGIWPKTAWVFAVRAAVPPTAGTTRAAMIGGLFYDNYPAGTGLVSGATFGRIAGRAAAKPKSNTRAIAGAAA